jgi:CelD/BcsL family acetyltransferase involved in cellulose biosynthesis
MLIVDGIESTEDFAALRSEWSELLEASASNCVFLTWEWMFTWWRHLSEDRRLHVITVRRDGRLVGIAPLAMRPRRLARLLPFRALEFLGTGSVGSDYLDLVVLPGDERDVMSALAEYLAERKLMLDLSQVRSAATRASGLALELAQRGWMLSRAKTDVCPYIDLSAHTWESYLASLGQAHRYNFQRRLKNLRKQFDVRFEQVDSEERRGEAMRLLIALHRKRWRERGGTNAFHTPALVEFHQDLGRLALERGWLRLYLLLLDGKPAAALYGFKYGGEFSFYQSGFDLGFTRHSVGLVTMGLAIRSAIGEAVGCYDLLHGDEPYKYHWARAQHELVRLELYPPRLRGALHRHAAGLRQRIKSVVRLCLPAPGEPAAPDGRTEPRRESRTDRYAAQVD